MFAYSKHILSISMIATYILVEHPRAAARTSIRLVHRKYWLFNILDVSMVKLAYELQ